MRTRHPILNMLGLGTYTEVVIGVIEDVRGCLRIAVTACIHTHPNPTVPVRTAVHRMGINHIRFFKNDACWICFYSLPGPSTTT